MTDPINLNPGVESGSEPGFSSLTERIREHVFSGSAATPTLWVNASTANAAVHLAERQNPNSQLKEQELEISKIALQQSHDRFNSELDFQKEIFRDESNKEWIPHILAAIAVLGGIALEVFKKDSFGLELLIAGAFTLMGYWSGRKSISRPNSV